jgi:hypothetical protein
MIMLVDRYCEHRMWPVQQSVGPATVAAARCITLLPAMQVSCGPLRIGAACTMPVRPPLAIIARIANLIIFQSSLDLLGQHLRITFYKD